MASGANRGVAAIVYAGEVYPEALFQALVDRCRARGYVLAGAVQHAAFPGARHRCEVMLEDLASGHLTRLFEHRGSGARGCRLDQAALADAIAGIEGSLETGPDLLVLNKFGKVECEGGGLRDLIGRAVDRGIAVVIAVPQRNLEAWRSFAGDCATELSGEPREIERWIDAARRGVGGRQQDPMQRAGSGL
jgi:hypothetical protein